MNQACELQHTESPEMAPCPAKIPGLERRRQTFYLTIVRPADLRGDSRSRYDFRGSLQTRDEAQARIKALELRAQAEARWEAQRASRRPQPTIPATAALADMLATKLRHEFLESDDTNRMAGKPLEHLPFLPEGMRSPQGSGFAAVEATQANIAAHAAALQWCLGAGQLEPFIQLLAYALEGTGLPPIDWDTDPTPFLRFARGMVSLFCDIEARAHGEPIETPAPTVPPSASPVPVLVQPPTAAVTTWEELQEDWQAAAKRTTTAIKITARSIREFAEVCPGVLPAQVTRGHAAKLRASLVAKGLKGKSVRNLIGPLVALLNLAVDSDKLATNPWRGIRVDTADSTKRLPWRLEQLAALAAVNNTREDPGRWLLPLLLYTGCRLGEVAQLELTDIREIDGTFAIEVHNMATEGHEARTVKTAAGLRTVPVHAHLLALGFREHASTMRAAGERFLFPSFVRTRNKRPSEFAGRYFLDVRIEAGISQDSRFSAHSTRHNVRSALMAANVNETLIDKLIGHESGQVQARYSHATMPMLVETIAKLDWSAVGFKPPQQ